MNEVYKVIIYDKIDINDINIPIIIIVIEYEYVTISFLLFYFHNTMPQSLQLFFKKFFYLLSKLKLNSNYGLINLSFL